VRQAISASGLEIRVEVDGGIADDTIAQAAEAGADAFVAGTAVYGADDPAEAVRRLRGLASAGLGSSGPASSGPASPEAAHE